MPRGSVAHAVSVSEPPVAVWMRFQDPTTWSGIGPIDDVADVRRDDDGRLVSFGWHTRVGPTRYRGKSTMVENVTGRALVMKLDSSEMAGTLRVDLTPEDGATRVRVQLDYTSKGSMASLFFPMISEAIKDGLQSRVEAFAAAVHAE